MNFAFYLSPRGSALVYSMPTRFESRWLDTLHRSGAPVGDRHSLRATPMQRRLHGFRLQSPSRATVACRAQSLAAIRRAIAGSQTAFRAGSKAGNFPVLTH